MLKKIKRMMSVAILVSLMLSVLSTTAGATPNYKNGAKTPPPPQEFHIYGLFNSNHLYLQDGTNQISQPAAGQVKLLATTYAKQVVDYVGITFYLQKWDGSSWADVGSGTGLSGTNRDSYSNNVFRSVTAGYYYRVRTTHWITESATYEQGERISGSLLVN